MPAEGAGTDPFAAAAPRVYTIAPGRPFLDDLAAVLLARAGEDPLALARITVLLPTRRAGRALAGAILRLSGGRPAILPRIHPLGDLPDESLALAGALDCPAPISGLARIALLSQLVAATDRSLPLDRAWRLARELAALMDELATDEIDPRGIAGLVPDEFAAHWQKTLRFLDILVQAWPRILAERRLSDPAERRVRVIRAQIAAWKAAPPTDPVIAAGSTGSIPAVADLLGLVARLPQGAVVLPGVDLAMEQSAWDNLPDTHPQAGFARLLRRLAVGREEIRPWPASAEAGGLADRAALAAAVFATPEGLGAWRRREQERWRPALAGLARVDVADSQEEALVAALAARRALQTPGRTVAIVTPDRVLARRIATELGRFGVQADDSGGEPVRNAPAGVFLRLLAACVASGLAPVPLLALLKHPLASAGERTDRFRAEVRALETAALRGPRPAPGLEPLTARLKRATGRDAEAGRRALDRISRLLGPLLALCSRDQVPLPELLEAHLAAAEQLAATPDLPGPLVLWRGEDGETLARHLAELAEAAAELPPVEPARFPELFEAMLEGPVVRVSRHDETHPRVSILGTLEGRLQRADVIVLCGLNEGTWPASEEPGPWLSRPMRAALGLSLPERRIGQAAHDVAQLLCAGSEVLLTRSRRVDGAPTVPSRWLLRLETFLGGQFGDEAASLLRPAEDLLGIARALDDPGGPPEPVGRPAPAPPLGARPRRLSVTEIATWIADPYALYARHVLGLNPLDPLDAEAEAADFGTIVHAAIADVLHAVGACWPEDGEQQLTEALFARLEARAPRPAIAALWRPRLRRIARFLDKTERERRRARPPRAVAAEVTAERVIGELPGGPFTLVARADRIEVHEDGLSVIDYKTGVVPSADSVERGSEPQLTLEAALAMRGAFAGVPCLAARELAYWRLSGGSTAGEIRPVCTGKNSDAPTAAERAWQGLLRRLHAFDDPAVPYLARPHPRLRSRRSDYAVLARIDEWSAGGGGEEEG